jgi:hypothetical protein
MLSAVSLTERQVVSRRIIHTGTTTIAQVPGLSAGVDVDVAGDEDDG